MGSFCTSGPQTTDTTQTQTYSANPVIKKAGTQAINMATSAANQPFQMPAAPVAGFTPFQDQAYSQIMGLQGSTIPYFANASQNIDRASDPVTQEETASYLNPYAGATLDNLKKYIFDPQRVSTMGNDVRAAGGVGAERLALTSQNLDKTQGDTLAQAMSGFYLPAMQQAQRAKEMALASGQGWANLGMNRLGAGLQETGALATAGAQQQAQQQRELMSPYQQTLARIAHPYQNAQFLAGVTGGLAPAFGGTTAGQSHSETQAPTPSPLSQIVGIGTSIAGLAMGMPPIGMMGGMGGGSPMGNIGGAPMAGFGPTGMPWGNFAARGGAIDHEADGGSVNPWNFEEGYDEGGGVWSFGDRFSAVSEPSFGSRWDPAGDILPVANDFSNPLRARGAALSAPSGPAPMLVEPGTLPNWKMPIVSAVPPTPAPPAPPAPPSPPAVTVRPGAPLPITPPAPPPIPPVNTDLSVESYRMPRAQQPYPDATERDWGQKLARSPWMSLVLGGAKMAQTAGPPGVSIGAGIEAGVGRLDAQRKELRNEEQINQKAESLYQNAVQELNKYTRMTPYQTAALQQDRYQWQPGTGVDPETGEVTQGAWRLPTRHGEEPMFVPGAKITGRGGAGGKMTVYEIKKNDWLRLNPGDEQGAINFANGKTVMSWGQIANLAAMRAQADANAHPLLANDAARKDYIEKRTKEWLEFYKQHNMMTAPSTPGP